jgi:2-polyprenyl-3-methyl-5-hydroxy-6-metoxy-1,4-benzoquinol methylase
MRTALAKLTKKTLSKTPIRNCSRPSSNVVQQKDARLAGIFLHETGQMYDGFTIDAEDVVIDIGCGDGCVSMFAANQGAKVIATDVCPNSIEITRAKLKKSKARDFEVHVSDSTPLPLEDNIATKVICREVLEHVEDPVAVMSELFRVGKPGATYLITVPDPLGESVQKKIAPKEYWLPPNHVRVFERDEFSQLLENSGLEIEKRGSHGFYWSIWWILFWAAGQELGEPEKPILSHWTATWNELIDKPDSRHIKDALEEFMPKSQILIAKKAA